ncbi:pyrroline-5-carboxylate reductase [Bacillus sp. JJ722]|uniref:pyrroline-5-carboxylate reductase n=1 Tax=Bacillus sp. JJ722 TaxID=3122973 RepID=UPI002FFEB751
MSKIAFVGAGSMAEAMISGITSRSNQSPNQITVMNRSNDERLSILNTTYGVKTTHDYDVLLKDASIVFLAMKPKDVFSALSTIKSFLHEGMLIVSVVAGVSMDSIETIINKKVAIIRSMPNTSATIGKSATAIAQNRFVTNEQLQVVTTLLETIGQVTLVQENQLDAVTGLSGSGPAYIYYLVEAMEQSAEKIGLDKEAAKALILQTIIGAAEMLQNSTKTPQTLRKEVTSPGGTTEAGIHVLQSHQVQEAFINCIVEATAQSKRLGEKLSQEIQTKSLMI